MFSLHVTDMLRGLLGVEHICRQATAYARRRSCHELALTNSAKTDVRAGVDFLGGENAHEQTRCKNRTGDMRLWRKCTWAKTMQKKTAIQATCFLALRERPNPTVATRCFLGPARTTKPCKLRYKTASTSQIPRKLQCSAPFGGVLGPLWAISGGLSADFSCV